MSLSPKQIGTIVGVGFVGILGLSTVFGSFYTVNQTERVVLLRLGAAQEGFVGPGLHFKTPFLDSTASIEITQQTVRWDVSAEHDWRQEAYSSDQQPAKMSISVLWHVPETQVVTLYDKYRSVEGVKDNLIYRRIPQAVKTVFGGYTAVSAIQDRAKLNADVVKAVQNDPDIANAPIVIDGIQVEDISFSSAYIESVEAAMRARVEVQKIEQQKQQQEINAQITVINAKAAADAQVAQATAEATSTKLQGEARAALIKLNGDAEAAAIKAKGDALRDNPQLVELTKAEKWNGALPTTVLPNGTLPFFNTAK